MQKVIREYSVFIFISGAKPWTNIMNILDEKGGTDSELLNYAMTLVNKVSNHLPWIYFSINFSSVLLPKSVLTYFCFPTLKCLENMNKNKFYVFIHKLLGFFWGGGVPGREEWSCSFLVALTYQPLNFWRWSNRPILFLNLIFLQSKVKNIIYFFFLFCCLNFYSCVLFS